VSGILSRFVYLIDDPELARRVVISLLDEIRYLRKRAEYYASLVDYLSKRFNIKVDLNTCEVIVGIDKSGETRAKEENNISS